MIDGCNRFQAYHKIVLPLVLPGITSTFIFSFLAMYTEYLFALIIYNPLKTEEYTIALAMLKVFQADLTQRGVYFNEMAVFALLVTLPILLLFSYLQKYLMQGLVSGGTKG
jgi:ABC-type glycerol-3-phosphate transport system permease component